MKMLDLFCGRWGWSRKFAERGHECVGIDLTPPPEIPANCTFLQQDILNITPRWIELHGFDFICASSPCEQFSVHGLRCFHPNPPHPELGLRLFNHTRAVCEASSVPYVMENVRSAEKFVGRACAHCGPFYLWGTAVPPLLHQGISKGTKFGLDKDGTRTKRKQLDRYYLTGSKSKARAAYTAEVATIPPELANTVCDYAERLLESRAPSS